LQVRLPNQEDLHHLRKLHFIAEFLRTILAMSFIESAFIVMLSML
jgi:hypothetical protein